MWFMDSLKNFWKKTKETFNNALDYTAEKIWEKSLAKTKKEVEDIIEASKTTEFFKQETWETKIYKHKTLVMVIDEKTDNFKDLSLIYPILKTKVFSQNMKIIMTNKEIEWWDLSQEYNLEKIPALLVFEDKKLTKTIIWKENLEKIWKSIKMNVEQTLDEF